MNLIGASSRETADIDVLDPKLSKAHKKIAREVAEQIGLSENWLNNGPADLLNYLDYGWKERTTIVFETEALTVYSLSRQELLNSKLWAACDRMEDIPDIVALKPTEDELKQAELFVLRCDASEVWPDIVTSCLQQLKERLHD